MAAIDNLVHQTTTTTGTSDLTLSAVNGKRTFDESFGHVASPDVFYYFVSSRDEAEWEVGTGSMSDATTLVRDTVLASSNSDALVDFSAGTKDVACDIPADKQVQDDDVVLQSLLTTQGDIIRRGASEAERLALGSSGLVLQSDGTDAVWGKLAAAAFDTASPVITAAMIADAELAALGGLTSAADKVPYFSGSGTAALADFPSVGRTLVAQTTQGAARTTGLGMSANGSSLVSAADYAAMRALLDLEAGTDFYSKSAADAAFQPIDSDLTSWAGVTRASGFDTFAATPSSANLKSLVTDETGSGGALVFATSPTLTDPIITGAILEDIFTISDAAAFEVDPGNGTIQRVTLGADRTPKATNFANGESVTLEVDDGTARTLTWTDATWGGSGVVWVGGSAPTLATSGWTVIELWKIGGQVYGASPGSHAA